MKKNKVVKKQKALKHSKNSKISIVILAILVLLISIAIFAVIKFIQNPTDTFSVEQGKIYQEERGVGYIIREETVVKGSNYKNGMEKSKAEGERVAKGDTILRYYSNGEESLVKKIAELDKKIEEAMANEQQAPSSDISSLEKQITDQIESLYKVNEMQTIVKVKKEIANNITKKAKIAGEYSPAGSYLKKLIDERKNYENQLNSGSENLTAPISGMVSYKIDGYEETLSPNDFSKLSSNFLDGLNINVGQVIAESTEAAKIINNFQCYIACTLKSEQAKNAKVGDKVLLRLPDDAEVSSEISYISEEENEVLLVFRVDTEVQNLTNYRKISFDIIWWSYSGKKVPNEAIAYEQKGNNQVAYIVRLRVGYENKILVKVLRQNDKYSIIENYTDTELEELGYTTDEISGRGKLSLYDEIYKEAPQEYTK